MWPEVQTAKSQKRREIVLKGTEINERISKGGIDPQLFALTELNLLSMTNTDITEIPEDIYKLTNLETLTLHSNKLVKCTENIGKLSHLKNLDLSRNQLTNVPEVIANLLEIVTLNLSQNKLESFPKLCNNSKLAVLDLSNNNLSAFPSICTEELVNLSTLLLNGNNIEEIPSNINVLPSLKVFDISENKVKVIPGELADCHKLKDLNLKSNPISDRRLLKLVDQCKFKQVIDYIRKSCPKTSNNTETGATKSGKKGKSKQKNSESDESVDDGISYKYTLNIKPAKEEYQIIVQNSVKVIREHIVCCIVNNITFTEELFKKFIQVQNKLHDGVCEKRNVATIATHDLNKLGPGTLRYTTFPPNSLQIKPLNRPANMSGAELFSRLQTEANNLRKEKKRSTYSGIHKYLYLIEGKPEYPALVNSKEEVVSFPPITNSDISKIEIATTNIFIEVTSSLSQFACKNVLTELLKEMATLFDSDLEVQQVRVLDQEEKLKVVFPSKVDLKFGKDSILRSKYLENDA